jgi:2-polyprenyl-3-methyl-5-hydroxy-6-metoxy-1,4-benzoquinol methylase
MAGAPFQSLDPTAVHPLQPRAAGPLTGDILADSCGKRIGILIVAYNAVTTLSQVLKRITPEVWNNVQEVVVFDDASKDATYELAVGYKVLSETTKLHVVKNARNLGYGGNQKTGYRYFIERDFDVVVLLHGDGQYAPEILSHLYHPIVTGEADAVFGSRMLPDYGGPRKGGMPLYKYLGNRILTSFENHQLGMNLTEFHSGYRAYSLQALRQINLSRMTDDFHFDTEIIIKLHHQGFRIREVAIPTYYGNELCYVNGIKYARNVAAAVYRYKRTKQSVKCFPEFQEYFVHYPLKSSKYSSHFYVRQFVGTGEEVLDCGCGEGFFASELATQGNRVTGIDLLPEAKHQSALEQYISADLDRGLTDAFAALGRKQFNKVLLMDVLEHLRHPELLLRDCRRVLKSNGQVLVSVPNVANITVRLMLLLGRFEYAQRGILDRTHLRFFTRRSARRLIEAGGYRVVREQNAVMPIELVVGLPAEHLAMKLMNRLLYAMTWLFPGLLAYQHVFIVTPKENAAA